MCEEYYRRDSVSMVFLATLQLARELNWHKKEIYAVV